MSTQKGSDVVNDFVFLSLESFKFLVMLVHPDSQELRLLFQRSVAVASGVDTQVLEMVSDGEGNIELPGAIVVLAAVVADGVLGGGAVGVPDLGGDVAEAHSVEGHVGDGVVVVDDADAVGKKTASVGGEFVVSDSGGGEGVEFSNWGY